MSGYIFVLCSLILIIRIFNVIVCLVIPRNQKEFRMTVPTLTMLMIGVAMLIIGLIVRFVSGIRDTQNVGIVIALAGGGWAISVLIVHFVMSNNLLW